MRTHEEKLLATALYTINKEAKKEWSQRECEFYFVDKHPLIAELSRKYTRKVERQVQEWTSFHAVARSHGYSFENINLNVVCPSYIRTIIEQHKPHHTKWSKGLRKLKALEKDLLSAEPIIAAWREYHKAVDQEEIDRAELVKADELYRAWMSITELYDLKDYVLTKLDLTPIGYHQIGKRSFALVEFGGHTFHSPRMQSDNYLGDIAPYSISSENKLEQKITVVEALKIIDDFLSSDFSKRVKIKKEECEDVAC